MSIVTGPVPTAGVSVVTSGCCASGMPSPLPSTPAGSSTPSPSVGAPVEHVVEAEAGHQRAAELDASGRGGEARRGGSAGEGAELVGLVAHPRHARRGHRLLEGGPGEVCAEAERARSLGKSGLAEAVARYLFKLMAPT
mgnify:CR=1 FL=1